MIESPLYDQAHLGDVQGVSAWLKDHPDDLNAWIGDGYALLHVACLFGHENLVRMLLDRMALVNLNAMNSSRATPLHAAVTFRDEEIADRIARVLIDNGAELNAKQEGGQTPLHHAVARGSSLLVSTLVMAGADPFLKDNLGQTPADLAKAMESGGRADAIRAGLKRALSLPLE